MAALDIHMDGVAGPLGRIEDTAGGLQFGYAPDALDRGRALSLSLPLREQPFGDAATRAFFAALLPEGAAFQAVLRHSRASPDDLLGLLRHLGQDGPGALRCVPPGLPPVNLGDLARDYDLLAPRDLETMQGRLAVVELSGGWGVARGGRLAPCTHLLTLPDAAAMARQQALMDIATVALPHPVAETRIVELADRQALLTRRVDRRVAQGRVQRLHVETFAQALGPDHSFTAAGVGAMLDETRVPIAARTAFRDITLLHLILGNRANHAASHLLLHDGPGRPVLAPLTEIEPALHHPMTGPAFAFAIGGAGRLADLSLAALVAFHQEIGFRINPQSRRQVAALRAAAADLFGAVSGAVPRLHGAPQMIGERITHHLRLLNAGLGLSVPMPRG